MRPVGKRFEPGRGAGSLSVVPKYIIITEGFSTEQVYFKALRDSRSVAGISGLIDIVLLQREPLDSGLSHPMVLLDLLDEYMDCVRARRYSVDLILETACNALWVSTGITRKDERMGRFRSEVREKSEEFGNGDMVDDVAGMTELCRKVSSSMFGADLSMDVPELIDYRPEVDKVCVIVDRDMDNRDASVIDEFIRQCRKRGYRPYISNPCFEIWLMMHFEAFDSEDLETIRRNPMIDGKRFTEVELDRIVREVNPENGFSKTCFDPWMFMHRIGEAVDRSMGLEHDPLRLKWEAGTNLGELLNEMRSCERIR